MKTRTERKSNHCQNHLDRSSTDIVLWVLATVSSLVEFSSALISSLFAKSKRIILLFSQETLYFRCYIHISLYEVEEEFLDHTVLLSTQCYGRYYQSCAGLLRVSSRWIVAEVQSKCRCRDIGSTVGDKHGAERARSGSSVIDTLVLKGQRTGCNLAVEEPFNSGV